MLFPDSTDSGSSNKCKAEWSRSVAHSPVLAGPRLVLRPNITNKPFASQCKQDHLDPVHCLEFPTCADRQYFIG